MTSTSCPARWVASALDITTGGISKVIDKLVTKGYVERVPGSADRRVNVLSVTNRGRRAHDEARQIVDDVVHQVLSSTFTAEEQEKLDTALTRLLEVLRQ